MNTTDDAGRLPHASKLHDLCVQLTIPTHSVHHRPTLSAAETQTVLPEGCLVQKSVTSHVAGRLVLWTGVGDFRITRRLHKMANRQLGLPAGSDHTLNPTSVEPLAFYGMRPGMVSPFIAKDSRAARELAALCVLDWMTADNLSRLVAVSVSLTESLIMTLEHLDILLHTYADSVYGHVPFLKLTEGQVCDA